MSWREGDGVTLQQMGIGGRRLLPTSATRGPRQLLLCDIFKQTSSSALLEGVSTVHQWQGEKHLPSSIGC